MTQKGHPLVLRGCIKRAILRLAKPEKAQFTKRK